MWLNRCGCFVWYESQNLNFKDYNSGDKDKKMATQAYGKLNEFKLNPTEQEWTEYCKQLE